MDRKSIAIIGARLNSSRLPGKHLLPLAGHPLIAHIVSRLNHAENIDTIILATTADEFNTPLVEWAKGKVECVPYDGDVNDLMGRINAIVEDHAPDFVTYICGDCPLIDPSFIDHGLSELCKHPTYDKVNLKPDIKSIHEGIEIYTREGWEKLYAASTTPMTREHVGYAHKLTPCLNIIEIDDSQDYSAINHRISVDTPADYEFMQRIYAAWYSAHPSNDIVDLSWVQNTLLDDPDLSLVNAHVVQKDPSSEYQKVGLFCHVSENIGMGHLKRCSDIAKGLQEYLGLGTTIHIHGKRTPIPWLNTTHTWYASENDLLNAMEQLSNGILVLDFHPDYIDIAAISKECASKKANNTAKIIAIDKLSPLLHVVDELFIPAFYSDIDDPKVSYGWDHYFIPSFEHATKKDQILILTGGSDALGYGSALPTIIDKNVLPSWDIIWIQGPYAQKPDIHASSKIQLLKNPENLRELMAQSKIILSCYGLSLFESIASGAHTVLLPPKGICSEIELSKLEEYGVCHISASLDDAMIQVNSIIEDPDRYKNTIDNAEDAFKSNNGAKLFSEHVQSLLSP